LRCDVALQNKAQWKSETDVVAPLLPLYIPDAIPMLARITWLADHFRKLNRSDIAYELEETVIANILQHPEWVAAGDFDESQHVLQSAAQAAENHGNREVGRKIWNMARARALQNF
jgi:hypothetical protein